MNYNQLFSSFQGQQIAVALIGAGQFGETFVRQCRRVSGMQIRLVCDLQPERASAALLAAGYDKSAFVLTGSKEQAAIAFDHGQIIITSDYLLIEGLDLDCVVEATGSPEAAAQVGYITLMSGFHLAMVTKEADIVVGPYLNKLAKAAGRHITPAHGDQPSLLIALLSWADTLGMNVIGAGKSSEYDFVFDFDEKQVSWRGRTEQVQDLSDIWELSGSVEATVHRREAALSAFPKRTVPDLCEMGIVSNHTGLMPAKAVFHAPHARVTELCDIFAPQEAGGVLNSTPFIDVFNCMRRRDEQSFGGGVFIIVDTEQDNSWEILREKGISVSQDGKRALLYNPSHLLGLEAAISVMSTVWLDKPTGNRDIRHLVDLHARASRDWLAGELLAITDHHHHEIDGLSAELNPAAHASKNGPLPYYMAADNRLRVDVKKGQLITTDMVIPPEMSTLWTLRREMEAYDTDDVPSQQSGDLK